MKIKKTDNVLIISGKDRGKSGLIEKVLTKENKVVVTGINLAKHHLKPSRKSPQGGIINMPAPIAIANVMVVCPHCGKPVRVAHRISDVMKERICRKCKGNLDAKVQTTVKEKNSAKKKPSTTPGLKEKND